MTQETFEAARRAALKLGHILTRPQIYVGDSTGTAYHIAFCSRCGASAQVGWLIRVGEKTYAGKAFEERCQPKSIPEWMGKKRDFAPRPIATAEIDGMERHIYPTRPPIELDGGQLVHWKQ